MRKPVEEQMTYTQATEELRVAVRVALEPVLMRIEPVLTRIEAWLSRMSGDTR